jgi:hypothetical protein
MHGLDAKELPNRCYEDSLLDLAEVSLNKAHQDLLTSMTYIIFTFCSGLPGVKPWRYISATLAMI